MFDVKDNLISSEWLEDVLNKLTYVDKKFSFSDNETVFITSIGGDNLPVIKINVTMYATTNLIKMRSLIAHNVDESIKDKLLHIINKDNLMYEYIKLGINSDNNVIAKSYFLLYGYEEDKREHVNMAYLIFAEAVDKVIPDIYRAIWQCRETNSHAPSST